MCQIDHIDDKEILKKDEECYSLIGKYVWSLQGTKQIYSIV